MKLDDRSRRGLIFAVLLVTLLAVYLAPPAEEPAPPSRNADKASVALAGRAAGHERQPTTDSSWQPQKRLALEVEPGNLFQVDRPPPPPAAKAGRPAPPPAPVAPPLPYSYMGRLVDDGVPTVFLLRQGQDKPYLAKAGDILDGQYRVISIHPPLVEFIYIPLGQKQTLNIGSSDQPEAVAAPVRPPANLSLDIQQKLKQMLNSGATP